MTFNHRDAQRRKPGRIARRRRMPFGYRPAIWCAKPPAGKRAKA